MSRSGSVGWSAFLLRLPSLPPESCLPRHYMPGTHDGQRARHRTRRDRPARRAADARSPARASIGRGGERDLRSRPNASGHSFVRVPRSRERCSCDRDDRGRVCGRVERLLPADPLPPRIDRALRRRPPQRMQQPISMAHDRRRRLTLHAQRPPRRVRPIRLQRREPAINPHRSSHHTARRTTHKTSASAPLAQSQARPSAPTIPPLTRQLPTTQPSAGTRDSPPAGLPASWPSNSDESDRLPTSRCRQRTARNEANRRSAPPCSRAKGRRSDRPIRPRGQSPDGRPPPATRRG